LCLACTLVRRTLFDRSLCYWNGMVAATPPCGLLHTGLENLSEDELRAACRARGVRTPYGEGAMPFMQRQMRVGACVLAAPDVRGWLGNYMFSPTSLPA
jgi:hypothetical protein